MTFNPCCCMRLQTGVRVVAIVGGLIKTILFVYSFLVATGLILPLRKIPNTTDKQVLIAAIIAVFLLAMDIFLTIRLFIGAGKRNPGPCLVWVYYKLTLLLITVVASLLILLFGLPGCLAPEILIDLILDVYMIVCVWSFVKELEYEQWEKQIARRVLPVDTGATPILNASKSTLVGSVPPEGGGTTTTPPRSHSPSRSHLPNLEV